MIKTIIFDFDGTIADTFESTMTIINSLAPSYGYHPFSTHEIDSLREKSMREIVSELHLPITKLPFLLHDFTSRAQQTISSQRPIPEIPKLLETLHTRELTLDIITSNSVSNVSMFLKRHSLDVFTHIYSSNGLFGKHRVISNYLRTYRISKDEVIYVGDEIRDIEAAHKAGIPIISVTWGFNTKNALLKAQPDYIADNEKQLLECVDKNST